MLRLYLMHDVSEWEYSERSWGLALDEVVDLILLAHEDEFVVAMRGQFLGAVELLAWGLEAHHGHACPSCLLHVLVRPTAYREH